MLTTTCTRNQCVWLQHVEPGFCLVMRCMLAVRIYVWKFLILTLDLWICMNGPNLWGKLAVNKNVHVNVKFVNNFTQSGENSWTRIYASQIYNQLSSFANTFVVSCEFLIITQFTWEYRFSAVKQLSIILTCAAFSLC